MKKKEKDTVMHAGSQNWIKNIAKEWLNDLQLKIHYWNNYLDEFKNWA